MVTGELSRVAPYRCFFNDSFSLPGVPFHDVMKSEAGLPTVKVTSHQRGHWLQRGQSISFPHTLFLPASHTYAYRGANFNPGEDLLSTVFPKTQEHLSVLISGVP